ncbi:LCP family protein [Catellatospora vulcania]|uniref:LCP family protein n=1 Tax=Catellatospora vulcania TaxID=1460450 RepID=UPI001E3A1905|nr:LCP family protein [Catellatospora vulcania]
MANKQRRGGAKNTVPSQRSRRQPADAYDEPSGRKTGHSLNKGKKKSKRAAPLWAKLTLTFGALLMMVAGGAIVGVKSFEGNLKDNVAVVDVLGDAGKTDTGPEGNDLKGPIDMLLLGIDVRATQEKNNARADTVLLLHIPATHDQAYLMSIPRDTQVDIPANPKTKYNGGNDKINAAFYFGAQNGGGWAGGLGLTAKTVTKLTGITFDGAAVIDFGGFRKIIDALGTVNVCVEEDSQSLHYYYVNGKVTYVNEHTAANRGLKAYVHKKGCREKPGWEALDYSRIRKSLDDGDYGRQRHQQQLIKAMAKKAGSSGVLTDLGKINSLMKAVGESMILDTHGVPLIDFMFSLKDLAGADLVLLKTNAGWYNSSGSGGEAISSSTMQMFRAAKNDTLGQFTLLNPEFVNREK